MLKQQHKLVNRETGLPEDGPQGASINIFVIWDDYLSKGIISPQDHMAALTPLDAKVRSFRELLCILFPRQLAAYSYHCHKNIEVVNRHKKAILF
jgi:hypothetical protein